ncbi:myosin light chain kinase, smooth muscle-like [Anthonomus grandis grandis]|uniref:myosin light chain kinase, smooth muscle-like n=1 Tax=Anthonomus grandis grandis TaxID=2921223 RepID=UPI002166B88B|nr:myosin light chain kinase, smooth muscle-like [Anthonomus grandis grandis]XP_050303009.1 myosin light chain kinase, smooth muscle-like [Anthonomus grandis grandis]XP_050303010.1 myosin light chain kinase, smooth muscle-like [Anthonomus grandis grandis]
MIKVDESDPVGEVDLSFPYRDVQIKRNIDPEDEYSLEEEIGRGKFGIVYKCKEKSSGLCLAAKFISCPKKEDRRNVEREIDIMRTLQHPRLIQMYDAFDNGKKMCVILELIEGGELFERVIDDDFILTEKACTVFMRQICEGVDFIHKQRILHLDMKPENVLCLTKTGNRIKIIDFGLARKFDPAKKLQVLFGTPEFVAPEVVNFDAIGYGTDMWSVGVICYVLLSGLSPFMGHTDVETMANVTVAKYDFDDEAFQNVSDNAKDFIRKLLIKDLSKRMTAEQCLEHDWLKRKQRPLFTTTMGVTKDNLRQFVERWNEHPNSPYVFEVTDEGDSLDSEGRSLSMSGGSPSPCGSLASSPGNDSIFLNNNNLTVDTSNNELFMPPKSLMVPSDHLRRASDSTCFVKNSDISERINLAEEIRLLSDRLFKLSNIDVGLSNGEAVGESEKYLPKDHPQSPACAIPWRKTKNKINPNTSRDVPLTCRSIYKRADEEAFLSSYKRPPSDANGTKDLLLRLLQNWDKSKTGSRSVTRHGSVSEWTEDDTLGQRSISSLNSFFQSRASNKKVTAFHLNQS